MVPINLCKMSCVAKDGDFQRPEEKSGHESSVLPVGVFRLLDFAFDSCDPDWEARVRCHHLRQGEIERETETWTNG